MNSKIFTLDLRDVFKGLVVAVLTSVLTTIYQLLQNGTDIDWKSIGMVAIISAIGYLIKNYLTDEDDNIGGIL